MEHRFRNSATATEDTCERLLEHGVYQRWVVRDGGLLWVEGEPGSGISTLLRYVLDYTLATQGMDLMFSVYFNSRGT